MSVYIENSVESVIVQCQTVQGVVSGWWPVVHSSFYLCVCTFSTRACVQNTNIFIHIKEGINKGIKE